MQASIPSIVGQMITFILFVLFTMKFVWPPLTKAMEERRTKIAEGLAAADRAEKRLADASRDSEKELASARNQARDIVANANKQAALMVEQARGTAQVEADRVKADAQADVERQVQHAREELRRQVGELAVAGATQILKREVNPADHADILSPSPPASNRIKATWLSFPPSPAPTRGPSSRWPRARTAWGRGPTN